MKHLQGKCGAAPPSGPSEQYHLHDPDGHLFIISGGKGDLPISKVALNVKKVDESKSN